MTYNSIAFIFTMVCAFFLTCLLKGELPRRSGRSKMYVEHEHLHLWGFKGLKYTISDEADSTDS